MTLLIFVLAEALELTEALEMDDALLSSSASFKLVIGSGCFPDAKKYSVAPIE
jgi:hypothetical protein